ncbi:hypothetical protein ACSFA3_06255 [Variovorax sp. RHLX14]|uniref:hypothetical protein n=1 Tax=unclassified Variovorax TaxID=663243 RepID=UPI003F47C2E4
MKIAITLATLLSAVTVADVACAQATLSYADLVRDARRVEKLEGSERITSPKVIFQRVKLDLKPFGKGSKDFYVRKSDEIGFICQAASPGFSGGTITGKIVKHEEGAEGSHFFTVDNCSVAK